MKLIKSVITFILELLAERNGKEKNRKEESKDGKIFQGIEELSINKQQGDINININNMSGNNYIDKKTEINHAKSLINFLCGQQILYTPCLGKCRNCEIYTPRSLQNIKEKLNEQIQINHKSADYKRNLDQMRSMCNEFRGKNECKKSHLAEDCSILAFRKVFIPKMEDIIKEYGIELSDSLNEVRQAYIEACKYVKN